MSYVLTVTLVTAGLFVGMLALLEAGRSIGIRRAAQDPERATAGLSTVDGAVFGLMGLLVAFTFSGAASRFDARRALIVQETNDIGTAYLRLDLLPADAQPALRESFRRYVDCRLAVYRKLPDVAAAREELALCGRLQSAIWSQSVAACRATDSPAVPTLVIPALNAMFDISTTRTMAAQMHPPTIIYVMLFGLSLASALLAGYGMAASRTRSWLHLVSFAAATALAVHVILDIEFPRFGLIRLDAFDLALVELRQGWDETP